MKMPIEVLAPAGGPDCLPAAVAGGANAVYLGLRHFNARGRAENFRTAELAHHVAYLHQHGLKCYVVMNTLIHDDEYPKALVLARAAAEAGVDALIIQDVGWWSVLAREVPQLKRHASTQMTVHDPSQIAVLARLGAERVILARELSLAEIAACTRAAHDLGIETEVFVHGALCYAFSGQCLMSNFAGCRSANRGTCAQNCRFEYTRSTFDVRRATLAGAATSDPSGAGDDLVTTGASSTSRNVARRTSHVEPSLSMKDLATAHRIAELAEAGVSSLKIEGRLKGPEYVFTTSRVYRAAVEAWRDGRPFDGVWAADLLKDVFSRPHTDAPLAGRYGEDSRLHRFDPVADRAPDAVVTACDARSGELQVTSRQPVVAGQGYAFTVGRWNGGFLVVASHAAGDGRWQLRVRSGTRIPPLPPGTGLFRNADHERKREAAAAMAVVPIPPVPAASIALDLRLTGSAGQPMTVIAQSADGRAVTVTGSVPLAPAAKAPLSDALVRDKLGAFGGTGFHLARLDLAVDAGLFVPAGELKQLRRQVVESLVALPVSVAPVADDALVEAVPATPIRSRATALWVAVGSLESAAAAFAAGADAVWLDDARLDLWGAQPPLLTLAGLPAGRVWLRHPPTARVSPHLAALGLPVVAGHLGVLDAARRAGLPVMMDHYANVFGWHAACALADSGAQGVVLSLECSSREVLRLAQRRDADTPLIALTVHGRLPSMLTRQDHGLDAGQVQPMRATPTDGGLPYEIQRRRFGAGGADTVIWEGRRLCAPVATLATVGWVDAWLLELADLAAPAVSELVAAYRGLHAGAVAPAAVETVAERHAPAGLFAGHLLRGSRELDAIDGDERTDAACT